MKLNAKMIGKRIQRRRKERGYTQEKLSELIGVSQNHLSEIERGVSVPTTQNIFKICDILGETPDFYLIGRACEQTNKVTELAKTLPPETQTLLCKLLNTYIENAQDN